MIGAAIGMLAFAPLGFKIGVFRIPDLGLSWQVAAPLYVWSIALAILTSIDGALAWTVAAQRVPVVLAAQLVVMEAIFGTVLGLAIHRRWPTIFESAGITVVIVGVVIAIRVFERQRPLVPAHSSGL